MYDINFYMKSYSIQQKLKNESLNNQEEIFELFESIRSKQPIVYNIETTNKCNMRCKMCPRTTKMTREISDLDVNLTERIIKQLKPHDNELWKKWEKFCIKNYGIAPDDEPSENHFFLYIIPKVIQLHGYGDPLLDRNLGRVVQLLSKNGFESYFSCNPANIDVPHTIEIMKNGLNYIKYSFESTDDVKFKDIRGNKSNFSEAFRKTLQIIEAKEKMNLATTIVITMIDIGHNEDQKVEFDKLKSKFMDSDVYVYLKSEDQQWYRRDKTLIEYLKNTGREIPNQSEEFFGTNSIHWSEFCKHPWMSMTIKSDGEVHMCMEDFNNEIFLGDAKIENLYNIWNGKLYHQFRKDHFVLNPCIKCIKECDMPKTGDYFEKN